MCAYPADYLGCSRHTDGWIVPILVLCVYNNSPPVCASLGEECCFCDLTLGVVRRRTSQHALWPAGAAYLLKPAAAWDMLSVTPSTTMSRSLPGRANPVAWEPKSTVRDCPQSTDTTRLTASTAVSMHCCSACMAKSDCCSLLLICLLFCYAGKGGGDRGH